MDLFRLHAYAVIPQRTSAPNSSVPPIGGAIKITPDLRAVMDTNTNEARFEQRPFVDFAVDTTTRTNDTRDAVINFAMGESATAKAAAVYLADRLSTAMDRRSMPCLFVPAALKDDDLFRVILWIFPREDAFQLRDEVGGPRIEVLTDVFSQKSGHRKAAQFDGGNIKTGFLQGRVLDHQADAVSRDFADFWIGRFLQCVLSLKGEAGTRLLAKTVRQTFDALVEPAAREQLHAAVMAMRNSPQRRVSLFTFGERYLDGVAKAQFLSNVKQDHALRSSFDFDRELFDTTLQFHIFELEKGVFVSTPPSELGETVTIKGEGATRHLTCQGRIIDEKLRTRHA